MKRILFIVVMICVTLAASAQTDRKEVRAGNRKFSRDKFAQAEIDYRKAVLKDSTSLAGNYNLASALYRGGDYEGASVALGRVEESANADVAYNAGDVSLQKKDYGAAVEFFRNSLLKNPGDLDAKENYIYAKKMLQNQQQQGGGGQNNDQNQDDNQDNNQDDNQDQNQDQQNNQDQKPDNQDQQQPEEGQISKQQAQQMLKAVQAKEKDTQDKVKKEKAALLQSRQKEKNW